MGGVHTCTSIRFGSLKCIASMKKIPMARCSAFDMLASRLSPNEEESEER